MQTCLSQLNETNHYKLILAFDEYEAIHSLLKQDPDQGERQLAAMRSFSQSQNKVVFLFVGAALFSELEQPNWSRYFVQVQRFRVDYLKHHDAIRLITEPVKLNYPPAVCEQMFELTQGHPALLQLLCSKMVDIANTENKKDMNQADLDAVVQEVSNERETSPFLPESNSFSYWLKKLKLFYSCYFRFISAGRTRLYCGTKWTLANACAVVYAVVETVFAERVV